MLLSRILTSEQGFLRVVMEGRQNITCPESENLREIIGDIIKAKSQAAQEIAKGIGMTIKFDAPDYWWKCGLNEELDEKNVAYVAQAVADYIVENKRPRAILIRSYGAWPVKMAIGAIKEGLVNAVKKIFVKNGIDVHIVPPGMQVKTIETSIQRRGLRLGGVIEFKYFQKPLSGTGMKFYTAFRGGVSSEVVRFIEKRANEYVIGTRQYLPVLSATKGGVIVLKRTLKFSPEVPEGQTKAIAEKPALAITEPVPAIQEPITPLPRNKQPRNWPIWVLTTAGEIKNGGFREITVTVGKVSKPVPFIEMKIQRPETESSEDTAYTVSRAISQAFDEKFPEVPVPDMKFMRRLPDGNRQVIATAILELDIRIQAFNNMSPKEKLAALAKAGRAIGLCV